MYTHAHTPTHIRAKAGECWGSGDENPKPTPGWVCSPRWAPAYEPKPGCRPNPPGAPIFVQNLRRHRPSVTSLPGVSTASTSVLLFGSTRVTRVEACWSRVSLGLKGISYESAGRRSLSGASSCVPEMGTHQPECYFYLSLVSWSEEENHSLI